MRNAPCKRLCFYVWKTTAGICIICMTIFIVTLTNFRDQYSEPAFFCIDMGCFKIILFCLSSPTWCPFLKAKIDKVASTRNTFVQGIRIEMLQMLRSSLRFHFLSQIFKSVCDGVAVEFRCLIYLRSLQNTLAYAAISQNFDFSGFLATNICSI